MHHTGPPTPPRRPWHEALWWIALLVLMGSMLALATVLQAD
jgi:hypothetical protein